MLKTYKKFREENGLADIKGTSDLDGTQSEIMGELSTMFREKHEFFRRLLQKALQTVKMSIDEENEVKRLIGLIGNLKDSPAEKKGKMRDPMDNVVVRTHNGADGSGGDGGMTT